MKTSDIFRLNRTAKRLNEGLEKTFGKKLNLESFTLIQLEDARNRLRTQLSQTRTSSGFNENLEDETYTRAQWMLDAINAEIAERTEFAVKTDEIESVEQIEVESLINSEEEEMKSVTEGEVQQASAIVTAKTMVDRVGRWIEELAGMENETLLQLGDSIRDEMGQEQAKAFISQVAPAIQSALENLKSTRETISNGVQALATGQQPMDMLGAEPEAPEGDEMGMAEPDAMNPADELPADDFAAAEPAAGPDEAGREKRESINFGNRLLKVLSE
jgi:hypothetical protein